MTADLAVEHLRQALLTAATLVAPALLVVFVVSLLVSVLQALTQVQDQTISLVPRLLAGAAAVMLLLPWMLDRLSEYVTDLYGNIGSPWS
jgi:flagellar biosynthetic protein FliQ